MILGGNAQRSIINRPRSPCKPAVRAASGGGKTARQSWVPRNRGSTSLGITASDATNYDVVLTGPTLVTTTSLAATLSLNTAPTFLGYTVFAQRNVAADTAASAIPTKASDAQGDAISLNAVGATSTSGGNDTFTITVTDALGLSGTGVVNVFVSTNGQTPVTASVNFQQNGSIAGLFIGIAGQGYEVQRSSDLIVWTVLKTVLPAPDGSIPLLDPVPPTNKAFYRIKGTP